MITVDLRRSLVVLGAIGAANGLFTPVAGLILLEFGTSPTGIGVSGAAAALGMGVAAFILPRRRPRGDIRIFELASIVVLALSIACFLESRDYGLLLVVRLVGGIAMGALFLWIETRVVLLAANEDRTRSAALYTALLAATSAVGPLIAGLLSLRQALLLAIGSLAAAILAVLWSRPLRLPEARAARAGRWRLPPPLAIAVLSSSVMFSAATVVLPLFALGRGLDRQSALLLLGTAMMGAVALQIPAGWIADRHGRRSGLIVSAAASALLAAGFPFALESAALRSIVLFLWGGASLATYTSVIGLIGESVAAEDVVRANGAIGVAWAVGAIAGPLAAGFAQDQWPALGFPLTLCIAAGAALILILAWPRSAIADRAG